MIPTSIVIECPNCGLSLKVKSDLAGKRVKCSGCAAAVSVPEIKPTTQPTPVWRRLLFVAVVIVPGLAFCPIAYWLTRPAGRPADPPGPPADPPGVVRYDFKGKPLPPNMVPYGPLEDSYIKVEEKGLRITIPKNRTKIAPLGLSMPVSIAGDFEITTTLEILQVDEPTPEMRSFGMGVLLSVNETTRIGRLVRAEGQHVVTWDRYADVKGKRTFLSGASHCPATVLRLRLKRTATALHFQWAAETTGDDFKEIHQCEFGADDITEVRVALNVNPSGQAFALDFRLIDLQIRSGQ